jgi:PAT family beta-lactamase induction signal transducer AmpG
MRAAAAFKLYLTRKILVIALLGFASGLPLALTASTLTVWLAESGVSKAAIGLFAAIGVPYTLKFLWSPLMDHVPVPVLSRLLGRRRAWIVLTQMALMVSLLGLGLSNPTEHAGITAIWALVVAICSASQDIVIDAYRVEYLAPEEQGHGAAAVQFGYRIGMLVAGAGALVMAELYGWFFAYLVMTVLMLVGVFTVLWAGEPKRAVKKTEYSGFITWAKEAVVSPFANFMQHQGWLMILLFVVLFKFGDALAGMMTGPFLIDIGFSKTEIAAIVKTYGLVATLLGVFLGGVLVARMGMMRALFFCAILQMASNLMFVLQAKVGYSVPLLGVTISVENLASGMGSAAFVAYLSSLCNVQYTATQYALLSSLAATGRTLLSSTSGFVVEALGWALFFVFSTVAAVPGIVLLVWLAKTLGMSGKKSRAKKPAAKKKR